LGSEPVTPKKNKTVKNGNKALVNLVPTANGEITQEVPSKGGSVVKIGFHDRGEEPKSEVHQTQEP